MPRVRICISTLTVSVAGLCLLGCASTTGPGPAAARSDVTVGGECVPSVQRDRGVEARAMTDLVDVGGRSLFIACRGIGRPTVVMETGFSDSGIVWGGALIRRVSEISRVCTYDRAGVGYSDSRPDPTHSGKISSDLHAVLRGAGVAPPYVLVGHSVGGMHVRVYDKEYPGEVSGMVLVDASHPDQFVRARERLSPADWAVIDTATQKMWHDPKLEPMDWPRSSELARQAGALGDRPLRVLSHDPEAASGCTGDTCLSATGQASWETLWQELQTELATLSTRGTRRVAERSGHYIQGDRPELVIEAIADVVSQTR